MKRREEEKEIVNHRDTQMLAASFDIYNSSREQKIAWLLHLRGGILIYLLISIYKKKKKVKNSPIWQFQTTL